MVVRLGEIKTITAAIYDNSVVYKTKSCVSNIMYKKIDTFVSDFLCSPYWRKLQF